MIQNLNQDIDVYCLVLKYATNGSLNDLIIGSFKNYANEQADQDFIIKIFKEILNGLKYLHIVKKIIHRDIKPDNILFDQYFIAKISDFCIFKVVIIMIKIQIY